MDNTFPKAVFLLKTRIIYPTLNKLHLKTEAALNSKCLADLNFRRRQELVRHAFEHSAFYREKYAGLPWFTGGIQATKDFLNLPPISRAELQENFDRIKADNVSLSDCRKVSTSGSTAPPISVLHDRRCPETPLRWRILHWWGVEPWENQAFIYRYRRPLLKRIRNTLLWWPTKRIFLAAANPNPSRINKFIRDFNRIKPTLLQGYVDVVFEFALYLLDNNIKIHPPKMVWVTSAPLFEEQRELMEKAFGAPVCDQYGNTEILLIAAECPEQEGLHMMQDSIHIEFVDDDNQPVRPGITGKILLTDLTNYAFPIIRYEIGDEGKYLEQKCSCDIPLPLMENVRGRQALVIQTPSGLNIRGEHLMAMFDGYMKAFKAIQLHQEKDYSVCMDFVPRGSEDVNSIAEKMVQLLRQRARSEISVQCRETKKVKRVSNKTPLIISHLN